MKQNFLRRKIKLSSSQGGRVFHEKGNLPDPLFNRDYIDIAGISNKSVRLDVHCFNSVNDLSRHNMFCVHYIPIVILCAAMINDDVGRRWQPQSGRPTTHARKLTRHCIIVALISCCELHTSLLGLWKCSQVQMKMYERSLHDETLICEVEAWRSRKC